MKKRFHNYPSFLTLLRKTNTRWLILTLLTASIGVCVHVWLMLRGNGQAQAAVLWPVNQAGKDGSPDGVWQEAGKSALDQTPLNVAPGRRFRTLRLNQPALQEVFKKTPLENTTALSESQNVLSLPLPDGSYARFRIEESPAMEPQLAAQFPEIKSYRGQGLDDSAMLARFDWSPRGLHAFVLTNETAISIQPARPDDNTTYLSFYGQDAFNPQDFECLTEQLPETRELTTSGWAARKLAPNAFSFGNVRRTFRIAIATTVEYTNTPTLGGGTAASALASVNSWLNAVNLIYERDLSVHLNLAANNSQIIFTTTDSFTNGDAIAMLTQVKGVLNQTIGSNNYDLGHVLGTGASGVANLSVVCLNSGSAGPAKGGGVSLISTSATVGNSFYITRIAHEIGHQFGATHSFNDTDPGFTCAGARSSFSAWESGSGLTIMSYAGSCNPITINRALHFHGGSLAQIADYLENFAPCGTTANFSNNPPTVNGGNDYHIPRNTPFALTAAANDADAADVAKLSYSWEEMDAGGANYGNPPFTDAGDADGTTRPIFRPYAPVSSPTRLFPSLTYILNNANVPPLTTVEGFYEVYTGESLPNVTRAMKFKVTVRDQRGGVADDDVVLNVEDSAGPFAVTAPNTNVSWAGGSSQTVNWNVSNTTAAPVSCAQVRILLSTDGGNTFPQTLLSSTANDGSETIVVPSGLSSTTARLKVEAVGNIFFDISNANFTLTPGSAACPTISGLNPTSGQAGATVTITGNNFTGVSAVKFSNNVNASFTVNSNTQITVTVPASAVNGPLTLSKTGCSNVQSASFTVANCSYTLNATTRNVAAPAGTNSINVTAGAGCPWTALSNANWITITSGASGSSNGVVNFSIAANTGPARTGTLTVAGQTVTVNQASGCSYTLSSTSQNVAGAGGTSGVNVTAGAGCTWGAASNAAWITVTAGSNGTGNGTVNFTIAANNGAARSGTLSIAGQLFTVNQASNCSFTLSATSQNASASAGTGNVNVTAVAGCAWTATSNANWLTITAGASGNGNGPVAFNIAANTGAARTGTLTIAGQTYTISQAAGCTFTLSATSQNASASAGTGNVNVTAGVGCAWTATSNANWLTITSGASGNGNGPVAFNIAANTGPARTGTLTIAGQTFTVSQASGCAVTLSATARNVTAAATTGTLNVTAGANCAWAATSNANWLTITSGASGTGNGTVNYSVAANTGAARTGTFSIGGVAFTVTQAAADCSFALSASSKDVAASATTANLNVTTASHCAWTATSNAPWLTISNSASGLGNGTVNYSVGANSGPARTGTLTIAGQTFTVNQASGCSYGLGTNQQNATAAGGNLSVNVTASANCAWTAVSNANWITLTSGASGTSNGTVNYNVAINTGAQRTGTLTIAGQTLTVVQAAASAGNPPLVNALNPAFVPAGNAQFTLTVNGANFVNGAVVRWNGSNRATAFVSGAQLTATITAADAANAGLASVTVFDAANNATSNAVSFVIAGQSANVSAASYADTQFAADEIVAVFGQNLATSSAAATSLPLPTQLAGTSVKIKDSAGVERLAALFFVSGKQVNYTIPTGTANGAAAVTIHSGDGRMSVGQIMVGPVAPGLFSAAATGHGVATGLVLRVMAGNVQRYEALSRYDSSSNSFVTVPIDLGPTTDQVYLVLYGTGLRQRSALNNVICTIGDVSVVPAYVGAQGSLAGLDQVNLLLPRNLAGRGEVEVMLTVDGKPTNPVKVQIK